MHIRKLNQKTVCMLGYGREGRAMVEMIEKYAPEAEVTIADGNPNVDISNPKHWKQIGEGWLENLEKFDVVIASPGIPPKPEFEPIKNTLTNSTQIFLDTVKEEGALVIGITGSKGKSTTSSLVAHVLKSNNHNAHLVGNIGEPSIAHIDIVLDDVTLSSDEGSNPIFVLEMSSAQLMLLSTSPQIAVVTSFFPEHLDYHASTALSTGSPLENYWNAKAQIGRFQTENDTLFFAAHFPDCVKIAEESKAETVGFGVEDCPINLEETSLRGTHNASNVAGAWKACEKIGITKEQFKAATASFSPLPHRLQSLGVHHDIEWIDDAISTTPDSTIAAIDALGPRLQTIIVGGKDRGLDFSALGKRIDASGIRTVILFGESGKRIAETISHSDIKIVEASSMEEVVTLAKQSIQSPTPNPQPPITLLSPSSPSYDLYKNFEEKGDTFRECIEK